MKVEKCCFCEKAIETEFVSGYSKKLKDREACGPCVEQQTWLKEYWGQGIVDAKTWTMPRLSKAGRKAVKANLSICGCGHNAKQHTEDAQANLLQCKDCICDRFHYYAVIAPAEIAVLSEHRTRLQKLRGITTANGASHQESEAAMGRILRLKRQAQEQNIFDVQ